MEIEDASYVHELLLPILLYATPNWWVGEFLKMNHEIEGIRCN